MCKAMAATMEEILNHIEATASLLPVLRESEGDEGDDDGADVAAASRSQALALMKMLTKVKSGKSYANDLAKICGKVNTAGFESSDKKKNLNHISILLATAQKNSRSSTVATDDRKQAWEFYDWLPDHVWTSLVGDEAHNVLIDFLQEMGLRNPDDRTFQLIAIFLMLGSEGEERALAFSSEAKNKHFRWVKDWFWKRLKMKCGDVTDEYMVELPRSPLEFMEEYPELWGKVYAEGTPAPCKFNRVLLTSLANGSWMRIHPKSGMKATQKDASLPSDEMPKNMQQMMQMMMMPMMQMLSQATNMQQQGAPPGFHYTQRAPNGAPFFDSSGVNMGPSTRLRALAPPQPSPTLSAASTPSLANEESLASWQQSSPTQAPSASRRPIAIRDVSTKDVPDIFTEDTQDEKLPESVERPWQASSAAAPLSKKSRKASVDEATQLVLASIQARNLTKANHQAERRIAAAAAKKEEARKKQEEEQIAKIREAREQEEKKILERAATLHSGRSALFEGKLDEARREDGAGAEKNGAANCLAKPQVNLPPVFPC